MLILTLQYVAVSLTLDHILRFLPLTLMSEVFHYLIKLTGPSGAISTPLD